MVAYRKAFSYPTLPGASWISVTHVGTDQTLIVGPLNLNQIVIAKLKLNWFKKQRLKRIIYKNLDRHLLCLGDIKSTYHPNALLHKLPEFSCFESKSSQILQNNLEKISKSILVVVGKRWFSWIKSFTA